LFKLPDTADTAATFDDLGIDSWSLVECRAILEAKLGIRISDDDWLSLTSPDDVLRLCP
jgi:acyl carrier protein